MRTRIFAVAAMVTLQGVAYADRCEDLCHERSRACMATNAEMRTHHQYMSDEICTRGEEACRRLCASSRADPMPSGYKVVELFTCLQDNGQTIAQRQETCLSLVSDKSACCFREGPCWDPWHADRISQGAVQCSGIPNQHRVRDGAVAPPGPSADARAIAEQERARAAREAEIAKSFAPHNGPPISPEEAALRKQCLNNDPAACKQVRQQNPCAAGSTKMCGMCVPPNAKWVPAC